MIACPSARVRRSRDLGRFNAGHWPCLTQNTQMCSTVPMTSTASPQSSRSMYPRFWSHQPANRPRASQSHQLGLLLVWAVFGLPPHGRARRRRALLWKENTLSPRKLRILWASIFRQFSVLLVQAIIRHSTISGAVKAEAKISGCIDSGDIMRAHSEAS